MTQRDFYVDRLRSVMTALVIVHHTAEIYGAPGGFQWTEPKHSSPVVGTLLSLFASTDVAFLMGLFFLISGYYTPASLEKKGYARFIADRFFRLGIPILAFGLVLAPLTYGIFGLSRGDGFWPPIRQIWQQHEFVIGPLWFAMALLLFSLTYCAWRAAFGPPLTDNLRCPRPVPTPIWWLVSALAMIAAALLQRKFLPSDIPIFGVPIPYRPMYLFLFPLGIAAWKNDWLRQFTWRDARLWILGLAVTWPALPAALLILRASHRGAHSGASNMSIVLAVWQPLVVWGIIPALLLGFRTHMNLPFKFWSWLNRRAYAVYILHPPVLVGISLLLHGWAAPALIKFAVVGTLACIATWLLADPLVRLPGVRRVV